VDGRNRLPTNGDSYVQWLDGPSEVLDAWGMHQRYAAGRRNRGVNLVDDRLSEFDDGRISYLSCFDAICSSCLSGAAPPNVGTYCGSLTER